MKAVFFIIFLYDFSIIAYIQRDFVSRVSVAFGYFYNDEYQSHDNSCF